MLITNTERLLLPKTKLKNGTVVFEQRSGDFSFTTQVSQAYEILAIGGGGGAATHGGGSSGIFIGIKYLNKGDIISGTVGTGSSGGNRNAWAQRGNPTVVNGLVSVEGGGGGDSQRNGGLYHGAGGGIPTITGTFLKILRSEPGNSFHDVVWGGVSKLTNTQDGPGAGGTNYAGFSVYPGNPGVSGIVRITAIWPISHN